jgi:hypothetical protein
MKFTKLMKDVNAKDLKVESWEFDSEKIDEDGKTQEGKSWTPGAGENLDLS